MRHILRTLLFILFLSFSALPLLAQRLEMDGRLDRESVSPRERDGRLSARVIIQSELRLSYKSNMGDLTPEDILRGENNGMYVDTLYFYITPGENKRRLTLSAVGYPAEVLPFTFKAKETYNYFVFDPLTRANVAPDLGSQYLVLNITPAEAEVTIDGGVPQVVTDGTKNFFLPYGTHTYSVRSRLYKEASGVVTIGSESRTELTVNLEPNFGYINVVSSPSGANVEINDMLVGKTPYKSNKMPLGEHTVRVSMPDYLPIVERVILAEGGRSVNLSKGLSTYLSDATVMCADADARIYINEEYKGRGRWSGELLPGSYELKVSKSGHKQALQFLSVESGKPSRVQIGELTPIYSKLNVSSEQGGLNVSLDGKPLGQAPNVFSNVLVGAHTLKFSKLGFVSAEMNVELLEGEILSVKAPTLRASSELISIEDTEIIQRVEEVPEVIEDDQPFLRSETMPTFQGGDIYAFRNWVQSCLKYPQIAAENGISGTVSLKFVIERDGTLTCIEILRTPDRSLAVEAIRVLKQSPKWTPGMQREKPVRVAYTLPVVFRIQD